MEAFLVGRRGDHRHVVGPGVLDRGARERGVVHRAERLLDHLRARVDGVHDAFGEEIRVGDEAVADAHGEHAAVRAGAEGPAVVGLGGRVLGLAGAVAVLHLVEGIVVVVDEVPAGDVVHVAVAVAVHSVAERRDQVLGIEKPVAVAVADARVGGVVGDVEDAVVVEVVRIGVLEGAGQLGLRVAGGVLGQRQLAAVEPDLAAQVRHGARVVPLDARVEHGDGHVGPPGGDLPGAVDAHALDAEELGGIRVDRGIAGLVARELPGCAAGEVDGPHGRARHRKPAVGRIVLRRRPRRRRGVGEGRGGGTGEHGHGEEGERTDGARHGADSTAGAPALSRPFNSAARSCYAERS